MSLFKIPSPKPRLARNGFDLSSRRIFSAKAGELLPIGCWEANPSEHFSFSVQDLVRTTTVNAAAYARMKEYYHFFFVSYKSLWQWFDQFIVGTSNPNSALNGIKSTGSLNTDYTAICSSVPSFQLNELLAHLASLQKDSQGYSYKSGACKLLNMLGYGNTIEGGYHSYNFLSKGSLTDHYDQQSTEDKTSVVDAGKLLSNFRCAVSPFRLLAYQKIFNDFYRVQDWSPADVRSFNVDDYADNGHLVISKEIAAKFCQMRYRPYSKDWLTSMKPTPNYDKGIFNLPDYVGASSNIAINRNNDSSVAIKQSSSSLSVTVNDLRAAFALDKMLEATRRANGFDYSSQIEAHFGFKVPESRAGEARFLGGFDNSIAISEVVSTANSNDVKVGDVGGKGIGMMSSGKISFDVKEHGIIMCVYSVAPQTEYNASFLDPFNRKLKREEFFQPEFADLGYQPVLSGDLLMSVRDPGYNPTSQETAAGYPKDSTETNNRLLGWQVRYNEYKTARDIVFGNFETGHSLNYWCTPRFDFGFDGKAVGKESIKSPWSQAHFYINPGVVNPIFLVKADESDHFLVNSYFDVKAVRPMSVSGLSSL
ncbi:MAG: major capsid protein [Prevotella fusca]